MINGKANKVALKHILCCLILLLVFVLTIGVKGYANEGTGEEHLSANTSDTVPLKPLVADNYFELETEKERDILSILTTFSCCKRIGQTQIEFCEKEYTLFEVLQYITDQKIPVLRIERMEPSLESLFMEVVAK